MKKENYPDYIFRGGEICLRQPIASRGTMMYGFFYNSTRTHLLELCNKALNVHPDRKFDYLPIGDTFMLTFSDLNRAGPAEAPDDQMGWSTELNAAIWIPSVVVRRGIVPVAERLAMYIPYMFVDNQYSLVGGREIYGFPKNLGIFSMPDDKGASTPFSLDTYGLDTFSPDTQAAMHRLLDIYRDTAIDTSLWDDLTEGLRDIVELLVDTDELVIPGFDFVINLLEYLFNREVPSVYLKQFRHSKYPSKATLQAIVEAPARIQGSQDTGLLHGDFRLKVKHLDSHPIDTDLGIPEEGLLSRLGFWIDFDFILERGKVIQSWGPGA